MKCLGLPTKLAETEKQPRTKIAQIIILMANTNMPVDYSY